MTRPGPRAARPGRSGEPSQEGKVGWGQGRLAFLGVRLRLGGGGFSGLQGGPSRHVSTPSVARPGTPPPWGNALSPLRAGFQGPPRHSLGWVWRPSVHPHHAPPSLFQKLNLFLVAPGPPRCARAFSRCSERGLLSSSGAGSSPCGPRLYRAQAQQPCCTGLAAPRDVRSS